MLQPQLNDQTETFDRYKERLTNFSVEFEFGLFMHIAKKSLVWIGLLLATACAAAWLYLRYSQNYYEAASVIQINVDNTSKFLNITPGFTEEVNDVASAIEVIRSKVFLKRALAKLPLQISYFAEGRIKTNEHYRSSPYTISYLVKNPAAYGRRNDIEFNSDYSSGKITITEGGKVTELAFRENTWVEFNDASILVTIDKTKLQQMLTNDKGGNKYYFTLNDPESIADIYASQLNVALLNEAAKTVRISFETNNPVKAYDLANCVAGEYIDYDVERRSESSKKVIEFIDDQLAQVTNRMKSSEDSLGKYRKMIGPERDPELEAFKFQRYGTLEAQLTDAELQIQVLEQVSKKLADENLNVESIVALLAGTDNSQALNLPLTNLQRLISEREEALMIATPVSEEIKAFDYQIGVQKSILIKSVSALLQQNKIRRDAIAQKMGGYVQSGGVTFSDSAFKYAEMQRLYDINEKFFNLLVEKKTEYSISEAGFTPKHVILEKAFAPAVPVRPSSRATILTCILVATLISILLVIIRYLLHDTINSLSEIMRQTNASVSALGIVPKYKHEIPVSQLIVDKNPKSLISESFRSLRTNLQFIDNTPGPKVLAVTSTISGEGKTFVAINLGGIIAYSGKKVIIIDLDMRKPKIHLGFGVPNDRGMSTLLIGRDNIESCIRHSSQENLHFITAGPIPPNPSELIISKRMEELLDEFKKSYDIIIVDNPPVGLVTDGIHIFQKADYPVYIFRAEYSRKNFIQIVDRLYNENNIRKLAVVLNGVDVDRKTAGSGYGYGYGYGYGSGYGYYDDQVKPKKSKGIFGRLFSSK